jgi:hypothetical protein
MEKEKGRVSSLRHQRVAKEKEEPPLLYLHGALFHLMERKRRTAQDREENLLFITSEWRRERRAASSLSWSSSSF